MVVGPVTIDKLLGKALYSNFNSFSSNLISSIRQIKTQRQSNLSHLDQDNSWGSDTHIKKLENVYAQDVIDDIRSKFDDIIQKENNINKIKHEGKVYQKSIDNFGDIRFNFEDDFPIVDQLINPKIRRLLKSYYGSHFDVDYIKLYRNYHIPEKVHKKTGIYSDRWHTDAYAPDATKLFVNLSDVTGDHGPLHVVSRSDTKALVNMRFDRAEEGLPGHVVESECNVMKLTGKAGSATIANSNLCLHRADNPSKGNHRDLAMLVFNPSSDPCRENWTSDLSQGRNLER